MKKQNKSNRQKQLVFATIVIAALLSVIGLTGCRNGTNPINANDSGIAPNTNNTSNTTTPAETTKTPADTTKTETTASRDKIGIPECDEYLEKYDSCLLKLPEVERNAVKNALELYRKAWKETATTKDRSGLARDCKEILEITKQTTRIYGCTW